MPLGNDFKKLGRRQGGKSKDLDKDRKKVVRKKYQWTKERLCVTYETLLVTQALDDKAYECHNLSSGLKHKQQKGTLWFRLK